MAALIRPYDIGCEPSPSVPAETVIQDGWKTYLLFFAVSKEAAQSGYLKNLGIAVLDCRDCIATKFGYPNDEGLPEHPLYGSGMGEIVSSVLEVLDSPWAEEIDGQRAASARRIWGSCGSILMNDMPRHFILTLKEKTFECLASSMAVERFFPSFIEARAFVMGKLEEH